MFIYNTYENQTAFYHTDSSYRVGAPYCVKFVVYIYRLGHYVRTSFLDTKDRGLSSGSGSSLIISSIQ